MDTDISLRVKRCTGNPPSQNTTLSLVHITTLPTRRPFSRP